MSKIGIGIFIIILAVFWFVGPPLVRPLTSNGPKPPELPPLYEFVVITNEPSRCGIIKILEYRSLKLTFKDNDNKPFLIQRGSFTDGETWVMHRWRWEYFPNAESYYKAYAGGKMVYACAVVDRL
ncbi:MAG: hypothetical protein Q8P07_04905 [bacterium]|nr:hypothetical protein [bacterium]